MVRAVSYRKQVKTESRMRWNDGACDVQLVETADHLHLSVGRDGSTKPLVTYGRGEIRSILDMHSTGTCTLHVLADDGTEHTFRCPSGVCVVLLVKLRKFQGANPEAALPEETLISRDA